MKFQIDTDNKLNSNWRLEDKDLDSENDCKKIFLSVSKKSSLYEQIMSKLSHIVISYKTAKKLFNLDYNKKGGSTVGPFFLYTEGIFEYSNNTLYLERNYRKSFADFWHDNENYSFTKIYPAYTKYSLVCAFKELLNIDFSIIPNPIEKNSWLVRIHCNDNLIEYLRDEDTNLNTFNDINRMAETIYSYMLLNYYKRCYEKTKK